MRHTHSLDRTERGNLQFSCICIVECDSIILKACGPNEPTALQNRAEIFTLDESVAFSRLFFLVVMHGNYTIVPDITV